VIRLQSWHHCMRLLRICANSCNYNSQPTDEYNNGLLCAVQPCGVLQLSGLFCFRC
jgi:hypothetical protein